MADRKERSNNLETEKMSLLGTEKTAGASTAAPAFESDETTNLSGAAAAATAATAVATQQGGALGAVRTMENPLGVLKNALTVDYNTLEQVIATNGNFMLRENDKVLGDQVDFEVLSFQDSWVVSPEDQKAVKDDALNHFLLGSIFGGGGIATGYQAVQNIIPNLQKTKQQQGLLQELSGIQQEFFPTQAQAEIEKKKVKKKIQDNAKILAADKVVLGKAQWKNLFKQKGSEAAKQMITLTDRESAININRTLREISKDFSLKMTFMDNPAIAKKVKGELWKNAQKITSIPDAYHDRVVKMLVKSGARGGDMTGMTAKLMDIGDMTRRQARNLSLDQTRKAYSSINAVRMKQNNMSKFQWLHSGGGANPREYHMHYAPAGLNGGIFELADPPVIDPETGERGLPGDLSHCGCTMKPIIDFDQYEDEA